MASNMFNRLGPSSRGTRSFYEQLRSQEDADLEDQAGLDEANLRENFNEFDPEDLTTGDSRLTLDSVAFDTKDNRKPSSRGAAQSRNPAPAASRWPVQDDEIDNDVPASLLVEPNEVGNVPLSPENHPTHQPSARQPSAAGPSSQRSRAQWEAATRQQRLHHDEVPAPASSSHPRPLMRGVMSGGAKEKALWRWVNTSNLDSFMRDVYDYYEGGGLWCILYSNALWLL